MFNGVLVPWAFAALVGLLVWKYLIQTKLKFKSIDAIPGPDSTSWLKGHASRLFASDAWTFLDHLTDDYEGVVKLNSVFSRRQLYIFDPKALQHVVLKDQEIYEESSQGMILRRLMFGPGVFGTQGEHHRRQRKLLNPVFSVAHMKQLTPIFYEVANRLREGVRIQVKTSETNEVDILAWMGRTALELIGQGGFGHSFDPLVESKPDAYAEAVKAFMPTSARILSRQFMLPLYLPFLTVGDRYPFVRKILGRIVPWLPHPGMHDMQMLCDTLDRTSRELHEDKKRALFAGDEEVKIGVDEGRDLMSILLRANMEASDEDKLPEEEIIAQMSSFTFAGTDTTSNALARILHLLSMHPDVQERLRKEIIEARAANGGHDLSYNDLVDLPYLDVVCRETMRLYPPVPFLPRETKADIILPLSKSIAGVDGSNIISVAIPKGTLIVIGIYSCNRNKAIWGEDAAEWKPERWLGKGVPGSVADAKIPGVYSNLLTFLGGGRACIGFKFSQLEMKVVLSTLLTSFRFSLLEDEDDEIIWNRASVTYPSTRKSNGKPSMPLKMEAISRAF